MGALEGKQEGRLAFALAYPLSFQINLVKAKEIFNNATFSNLIASPISAKTATSRQESNVGGVMEERRHFVTLTEIEKQHCYLIAIQAFYHLQNASKVIHNRSRSASFAIN